MPPFAFRPCPGLNGSRPEARSRPHDDSRLVQITQIDPSFSNISRSSAWSSKAPEAEQTSKRRAYERVAQEEPGQPLRDRKGSGGGVRQLKRGPAGRRNNFSVTRMQKRFQGFFSMKPNRTGTAARRRRRAGRRRYVSQRRRPSPPSRTTPRPPSTVTVLLSGISDVAFRTPTTAGMPSSRATMEQ